MSFHSGDSNWVFYSAADLGGGWKWLNWFGYYAKDMWQSGNAGWINHLQHGWIYLFGYDAASLWLWSSDMGWLWTSRAVYPNVYRNSDGKWLWYQKESKNPRWFLNYSTGNWEEH